MRGIGLVRWTTVNRSLVGQSGWMVSGSLAQLLCQWAILVLVARKTSAESLGQFGLALAILGPTFTLANMNLRGLLATDAAGRFPFAVYLAARVVAGMSALAAVVLVAWLLGTGPAWLGLLLSLGLAKFFEAVADLVWGLQQHCNHFARVGISSALHGSGMLGCAMVAAHFQPTLPAIALGMLIGRLLVLVGWDLPCTAGLRVRPGAGQRRPGAGELLALAWPLGITGLLVSLHSSAPRYLVQWYADSRALGVFCALAAFPQMTSPLFRSLEQTVSVRLARLLHVGRSREFWRLLGQTMAGLLAVGILAVLAAWLAGRPLVQLVYPDEYAEQAWLLVPLMLAAAVAFQAGIIESALTCVRWTCGQLPLHAASLLGCVAAGWWLVPRWGLGGAAASLLVGKAVFVLISLPVLKRVVRRGAFDPQPDGTNHSALHGSAPADEEARCAA